MSYPNEDEGPDEVPLLAIDPDWENGPKKPEHTPLPWSIRPNKFDDWGFIRGAGGQTLACIARGTDDKEFDEHRRDGTDPYQANADLIVHSVNVVPDLIAALKEAERFMDYFAEDRTSFVGPGTPMTCLAQIRTALSKVKP